MPILWSEDVRRARFWARAIPDSATGCWNWNGSRGKNGYGTVTFNYRTFTTHRLAYQLHHGVKPGKRWVLHRCDNRLCVNPGHLFLGTALDNVRDMMAKGRDYRGDTPRGARHHSAKLTEHDVCTMRTLFRWGMRMAHIAQSYGVMHTTAKNAVEGRTWRHV